MTGYRRYAALVAVAVFTLVLAAACTPEAERETEQNLDRAGEELEAAGESLERGAEDLGRELEPYARDAEITTRIKTKLTVDPQINPFTIDVDTVNGRVTLSGTVRTEEQREEAEKLARDTEGVLELINLLEVGERG